MEFEGFDLELPVALRAEFDGDAAYELGDIDAAMQFYTEFVSNNAHIPS